MEIKGDTEGGGREISVDEKRLSVNGGRERGCVRGREM